MCCNITTSEIKSENIRNPLSLQQITSINIILEESNLLLIQSYSMQKLINLITRIIVIIAMRAIIKIRLICLLMNFPIRLSECDSFWCISLSISQIGSFNINPSIWCPFLECLSLLIIFLLPVWGLENGFMSWV